jgi:hypothetical protein
MLSSLFLLTNNFDFGRRPVPPLPSHSPDAYLVARHQQVISRRVEAC